MENRLAKTPANHPLAISIAASALTLLVVLGSLLIEPWQKCTSSNQSNGACLQSEFVLFLSQAAIQGNQQQPAVNAHTPPVSPPIEVQIPLVISEQLLLSTTETNISPLPYVPQFPDFILPRPEPETQETIPAPQEGSKEQKIPDFVILQMSTIRVEHTIPPLPRAPSIPPSQMVKLQEVQLLRFSPSKITIQDGDNLWAISNRIYGAGRQYIRIFEANKGLISSPHKIFPGQILALPKGMPHSNIATE